MAILGAWTDARVELNAVVLSDHVRKATLNVEAKEGDTTAMGDTWEEFVAGLKSWAVELEFNQDFAAANVDATLFPLVGAAAFTVKVRPTTGAVSATNPEYNGSCILTSYAPLGGSVGDVAMAPVTLKGSGALTRSIA